MVAVLIAALSGCSVLPHAERPAWRTQAENVCLGARLVPTTASVQPAAEINGPGICGLTHPFRVTALGHGDVALSAAQTLACPMLPALDAWLEEVVQPAALARFGQRVARVDSMGSYGCRSIDNQRGARLSEHAFGNAIDIGGFRLADGRAISVEKGWRGADEQERAFLHEVHAGACNQFTTVLGPGADIFHYNHIHVDLAQHGNTSTGRRRVCKPLPQPQLTPAPQKQDDLPDPPMLDEEQDVAGGGGPPVMALHAPPAPPPRAHIREDGVFVPPGLVDDAATSAVRRR